MTLRSRITRRHWRRRWDGEWQRWRSGYARLEPSLFEHRPDERNGEAALSNESCLIQRIQELVHRSHVPGEAPLEPTRRVIRKLESPQPGPQLQSFLLLPLIQLAQLKDRRRSEAGAQVRQPPRQEGGRRLRSDDQSSLFLL